MKRSILLAGMVILFAITSADGFQITLKRDPFMDLLKLKKIKQIEMLRKSKIELSRQQKIKREMDIIASSLKVKMIVTSKDPSLNAALIVGPSGIPVVVTKGYKIKDNVYIKEVKDNEVVVAVNTNGTTRTISLKLSK
ncbi:hypothetical protein [Hippea sp. KM1]|uniref:hypothetical protein n=1 Tax=Hippea sp. KM1 TaxID=944481 RepID=UPI00046D4E17|nr:hypothetical protein [Hippea sp. KM1]